MPLYLQDSTSGWCLTAQPTATAHTLQTIAPLQQPTAPRPLWEQEVQVASGQGW